MEKITCKECGKELSSKAKICPNCGVEIKQKGIKGIAKKFFKLFQVVGVIFVIGIIVFIIISGIRELNYKNIKKGYVGIWELKSQDTKIPYNDRFLLIDKSLKIDLKNVFEGLGDGASCSIPNVYEYEERCDGAYPTVFLNSSDKIVGITFVNNRGSSETICFEKNKDELNQVSCNKSNGAYKDNGGIKDELGIKYIKSK